MVRSLSSFGLHFCVVLLLVPPLVPVTAASGEDRKGKENPVIDGDAMLLNQNAVVLACVLKGTLGVFDADAFIEKALSALDKLSKDEYNHSSQFELLEYCSWGTTTVDAASFCIPNSTKPKELEQVLVRFGVSGVDAASLKALDFSALSALAGPIVQEGDTAFLSSGGKQHFIERMLGSENTLDELAIVILFCYPIFLVYHLLTMCARERARDRISVEFLRNSINSELSYRQHMKCADSLNAGGRPTRHKDQSDAQDVELEDMAPSSRVNEVSRGEVASGEAVCDDTVNRSDGKAREVLGAALGKLASNLRGVAVRARLRMATAFAVPPASDTTRSQREVELTLVRFLQKYRPEVYELWGSHSGSNACGDSSDCEEIESDGDVASSLCRESHKKYLQDRLLRMPEHAQTLYNAQPWIVYWTLQAAGMLGIEKELYEKVPPHALGDFLLNCLQEQPMDDEESNCGTKREGHWEEATPPPDVDVLGNPRRFSDHGRCAVGFAGGSIGQIPHLATTYAAVCSLCALELPEYLRSLPRAAIKRWFLSLRCADGSFRMHVGGEADIRASYCVAVVTTLLQLQDVDSGGGDILTDREAKFVASCQTHEGGFACGRLACEAHGAYTQCGLASLMLMRRPELCNYTSLRGWLAARQLRFEGGFNGRTNKLVDSCYAHWVGASHVLLRVGEALLKVTSNVGEKQHLTSEEMLLLDHAQLLDVSSLRPEDHGAWTQHEEEQRRRAARVEAYISATSPFVNGDWSKTPDVLDDDAGDFYFNQRRLQLYLLACCQDKKAGGLMDKPGCPNDFYHTCYSLSGMSSAQNLQYIQADRDGRDLCVDSVYATALHRGYIPGEKEGFGVVLCSNGHSANSTAAHLSKNRLRPSNPIFNLNQSKVLVALRAFGAKTFLY